MAGDDLAGWPDAAFLVALAGGLPSKVVAMGVGPTFWAALWERPSASRSHLVLETGMLGKPIEASWFAIVIGLLTGLGVRQANRNHMDRSYLRAAISAALALAAIFASTLLIAEYMKKRDAAAAASRKPPSLPAPRRRPTRPATRRPRGLTQRAEPRPPTEPRSRAESAAGGRRRQGRMRRSTHGSSCSWRRGAGGVRVRPRRRRRRWSTRHGDVPPEGLGRATDPSE